MFDMHTHFIPKDVLLWIKDHKRLINAEWVKREEKAGAFLTVNNKWGFELKESFIDSSLYLQEQEKAGVLHSLISPIPQLFLYDFPEEITKELSSVYNLSLANWVKNHNKKLSSLATIPLNNPSQAAKELRSAMELGLKGAIIGPGLE
ncbi:amidohydrolase, partial [Priestia megaterium]